MTLLIYFSTFTPVEWFHSPSYSFLLLIVNETRGGYFVFSTLKVVGQSTRDVKYISSQRLVLYIPTFLL